MLRRCNATWKRGHFQRFTFFRQDLHEKWKLKQESGESSFTTVLASLAVSKHISLTSVTTVKQPSETVPHFAALLMMLHHDVSVVRSLKRRRKPASLHCTDAQSVNMCVAV